MASDPGAVHDRLEAIISLRLRGPAGTELEVDAVVDSGYTASLTLPDPIVLTLELILHSESEAVMADGSLRSVDVYAAEVFWDGVWRQILISSGGGEALLGMRLLEGYELRIGVEVGGPVKITLL